MATIIRGVTDDELVRVRDRLEQYESDFPGASAELYRQNSSSIRIRIIDDRVASMNRSTRHARGWAYLTDIGDEILQQITVLLLLPKSELASSLMSLEFDDPIPSTV